MDFAILNSGVLLLLPDESSVSLLMSASTSSKAGAFKDGVDYKIMAPGQNRIGKNYAFRFEYPLERFVKEWYPNL